MHRRFNRCMYFHRSSFGNAPTYTFSLTSVNPVSVSSVSSFWTITQACVFSLTSVQPSGGGRRKFEVWRRLGGGCGTEAGWRAAAGRRLRRGGGAAAVARRRLRGGGGWRL